MREIKFRGKRIWTDEWIYGNLVIDKHGRNHIVPFAYFDEDGHHLSYDDDTDTPVFIMQESVGQFTGLHDKNGKEIYEGDIVKFEDVSGYKDGCASVIWHEDSCGYYLENDDDNIYDTLYDFTPSYQMEIIGNIHENPELLEGRE